MTTALTHRGPDSSGNFSDELVSLGHTRLSILDLSERANQPIHSHNGRFVMVYNGEVYNYEEIANELKQQTGINFRTSSDSEVVLEAFALWGTSFTSRLNGMFAMAVYDRKEKALFLFRDRVGIKPLFYYFDGKNLAFASELKSLLKIERIPRKVDKDAVADFLHLGFIPAPSSVYKSIKKLDSGTYLKISAESFELSDYWNISEIVKSEFITDENEALRQLENLLISSVQYQLKSDVPFGVFLSGGIDSSLISALASKQSGKKINTFSIGFKENAFDESPHARKVATYLGTEHHEFIVSYRDVLPLVDDLLTVYDEPYSDSSAIPTLLVSKLARKHVKVALSGEGGDELFLGYGSHLWAKRLSNPFIQYFHQPISSLLNTFPNNRFKRASGLFRYSDHNSIQSHIFSQEQYLFSEEEVNELMTEGKYKFLKNHEENTPGRQLQPSEIQAMFDFRYYLKDDLLTKVDRASMHHSLETRVPYLDHRIVEFALNLSPSLKIKEKTSKYILKKLLYRHIPEQYFQRKKQGFAIPLNMWLHKELKYLTEDYLSKEVVEQYGLVNYSYVDNLKKQFSRGRNYLYNRLWQLIVLHKFMKES